MREKQEVAFPISEKGAVSLFPTIGRFLPFLFLSHASEFLEDNAGAGSMSLTFFHG